MDAPTIQLHPSWLNHLKDEFQKDYMVLIKKKLLELKKNNIPFYPPGKFLFNAFNLTPLDQVKVVNWVKTPTMVLIKRMAYAFQFQTQLNPLHL